MRNAIAVVSGCLLLSACAGIDSYSIRDNQADERDEGFRYYETSPFLLVYADGKGGLESKLLYLPDTTKKRSIKPYNFASTNDTTLKFDKGRLVQAKAVVDETIIPAAIISSLEKVATANIKAGNGGAEGIPSPYLFRIVGDGKGGWALKGGQAMTAAKPAQGGQPAEPSKPVVIRFAP